MHPKQLKVNPRDQASIEAFYARLRMLLRQAEHEHGMLVLNPLIEKEKETPKTHVLETVEIP